MLARGKPMEAVYVVGSGTVETHVTSDDGRRLVLRHGETGRAFGLLSLVDRKGAPHDVVAIEASTIVHVPLCCLEEALQRSPCLWASIAAELAARFRRQISMTEEITFEQILVRFARELLNLASLQGKHTPEGVSITLRLSQERLGELVGVSRQTAATHIRNMVESRLLSWHYGHITIRDMERLRIIAAQGVV